MSDAELALSELRRRYKAPGSLGVDREEAAEKLALNRVAAAQKQLEAANEVDSILQVRRHFLQHWSVILCQVMFINFYLSQSFKNSWETLVLSVPSQFHDCILHQILNIPKSNIVNSILARPGFEHCIQKHVLLQMWQTCDILSRAGISYGDKQMGICQLVHAV